MPPTKKRARSPEVDGLSSTRQRTSFQNYQNPLFKKRRWRGPKDDPIRALQKIERKRRAPIFWDTGYRPNTAGVPQIDTHVHRTIPAPVKSSLQRSPGPAVQHSPPSLPTGGDEGEPESFKDSPVSSHAPLGSGLRTASNVRDNRALLRQTRHLDNHTSARNERPNDQVAQWVSVAISRLIPTYLANRAATESGRLPPPPKPNHQCQCNKEALQVEIMTWGRSSQQILSDCECYPAGVQLIEMGYFPSALVRPTLALDINMLEFVAIGLHSEIEYYPSITKYLVCHKDTNPRCFGSALHWYRVLVEMANQEVDK